MLDILKNKIKYIARIPVSLLNVDYTYQKPLSMAHARKIAKNFNPQGVGQIHVSKRDDGSYYIFDGQHRWTAYEMLELEVIECIVYEGMTIKEEAEAYNLYNTIKTQNALDREKALLVAGDKDAALRKATVEELGLEIDYDRTNHNDKIQAVGAVVEIYNKFGVDGLHNVLSIIKQSFGTHKKNYQAMVMQGVFDFIKDNLGKFDVSWLIKRLQKFGIDELLLEHNTFRRAHNCSKREAIKLAMIKFYNHGKRSNKL